MMKENFLKALDQITLLHISYVIFMGAGIILYDIC